MEKGGTKGVVAPESVWNRQEDPFCPNQVPGVMVNSITKSNLGKKEFLSSDRLHSTIKEA